MSPEREERIRKLAEEAAAAQICYENSCMANTPTGYKERLKAMADHAVATARMFETRDALNQAIEGRDEWTRQQEKKA